mgnify:CR=1 FL=1
MHAIFASAFPLNWPIFCFNMASASIKYCELMPSLNGISQGFAKTEEKSFKNSWLWSDNLVKSKLTIIWEAFIYYKRLYNQRYKISLRPATSDSVGLSNLYLCLASKPNLIRTMLLQWSFLYTNFSYIENYGCNMANRKINTHVTTLVSLTHFAKQNFTNFPVKN